MGQRFAWMLLMMILVFPAVCAAQEAEDHWFEVSALNPGLGAVPEEVERLTPRESIRSFFELAEKNDFAAAAHLLNLEDLSPQEQAAKGPELARQLASVLQHGEWVNISSLPARRDAMIDEGANQHPRAGEARRNLKLASLEANGQTYDIRLARYKAGDQQPVWLFMPDTLSVVPALYEAFGPAWVEPHIPERFKQPLGMLRLWEWLAIPLFIGMIGLLGFAVYSLTSLLARWLPAGVSSIFAGRVGMPLAFIVMSLVAQWTLGYVVSFSGAATTVFRILLALIMAWGLGLIALRFVDTILLKVTSRLVGEIDDTRHQDERRLLTTLYALRRTIILITVVIAAVYVLGNLSIFDSLGMTLLASASVLTVLVGIAGQAVLGNILASFQVALAKPVRIGDSVFFEGQWCYVEGIFYTFIRLRTWDERRLIVPVTYFISKPFENWSTKNAKMYRQFVLTLHLSADVQCLRDKFQELAKDEEGVIDHDRLLCYVTGQSADAQEITFYLMTPEPMSGWLAETNLRERMLAFVREQHPEWWPREVVVISHQDVARGHASGHR
ncbi:mechanosensitive ion channel family protein [Halomonas nitroreducens]|uniref:Mechanosensitive ion channel n=1 Tax=Halomonas nitroreducens TaxID=447425 RepID=A0A431V0K1_9GAMM|nr:mechanosensitive ion channel domain-containing protein [Halomonas nitroreducens]RTR01084.1 mechanosensitive ion channel [Halomonas nitroreducens]